jgi:hypothetical protein
MTRNLLSALVMWTTRSRTPGREYSAEKSAQSDGSGYGGTQSASNTSDMWLQAHLGVEEVKIGLWVGLQYLEHGNRCLA